MNRCRWLLVLCCASLALATTSFSPTVASASDIRANGVVVTISSDVSIFNIVAAQSIMPSSKANETATVLFSSSSQDDTLAHAISSGVLKVGLQSASSLTLTFVVTGNYFAYTDGTLCITVLRNFFALSAAAQAPFNACVDIPAQESFMKTPREITVGVLGAASLVFSLVGRDSHNGLLSLGRQSLIGRLLECNDDLDFILHPTQIEMDSSAVFGCLMINMSIVILLALFHTAVLRQFPKIFSPYLPGDHLIFLLAAFSGITISTYDVVIRSAAPLRWALALVILFLTYIALLGCLYLTHAESTSMKFYPRFSTWSHAMDPNFAQRWRVLFKPYRGGLVRWYFLAELVTSGIVAVACALPQTSASNDGCFVNALVVGVVVGLDLLTLLVVWPYHSGVESIFAVLMKMVECSVAALTVVGTLQPNVNDAFVIGGNSVLIVGGFIVFVKYIAAVIKAARGGPAVDKAAGDYVELMEREQREQEDSRTVNSSSKGILKSPVPAAADTQLSTPSAFENSSLEQSLLSPRQRGKSVVIVAGPDEGLPPPKGSPYPVKSTPPKPIIPLTGGTSAATVSPLVLASDTMNKGVELPSLSQWNQATNAGRISPIREFVSIPIAPTPEPPAPVLAEPVLVVPSAEAAPITPPTEVVLPPAAEGSSPTQPEYDDLEDLIANNTARATAIQEWRSHTAQHQDLSHSPVEMEPLPTQAESKAESPPRARLLEVPTDEALWQRPTPAYSSPQFAEIDISDVPPPATKPRSKSMALPSRPKDVVDEIFDDLDRLLE